MYSPEDAAAASLASAHFTTIRCLDVLEESAVVRLLGPSGSGKSSVLRQVAAVMSGRGDVVYVSQQGEATMGAGDVEEMFLGSIPDLSGEMSEIFELSVLWKRPLRELSHGERKRVALAAALSSGASVCVLDEPTWHLDAAGNARLRDALRSLKRSDRAAGTLIKVILAQSRATLAADLFDKEIEIRRFVPLHQEEDRFSCSSLGDGSDKDILDDPGLWEMFAPQHPPSELVIEDLQLPYPERDKPLKARLSRGEVHLLTGPAGSGKTTLLRALAGFLPFFSGTARLLFVEDGSSSVLQSSEGGRSGRRRRAKGNGFRVRVGYVSADRGSGLFCSNMEKELDLGRHPTLSSKDAQRLLSALWGIKRPDVKTPPMRLPAARKLMLSLAATLVGRPQILLMDEPAAGLDDEGLERLVRALGHTARHALVLVSAHEPCLLQSFSQRLELGA